MVLLIAVVYPSERDKARSAQEKATWGEAQKGPGSSFQSLLPGESHRMLLIPQQGAVITRVKCRLPGELLRDVAPRVFTGLVTWAPSAWHRPKQLNCEVISLGRMSHSSDPAHRGLGPATPPPLQMPAVRPGHPLCFWQPPMNQRFPRPPPRGHIVRWSSSRKSGNQFTTSLVYYEGYNVGTA